MWSWVGGPTGYRQLQWGRPCGGAERPLYGFRIVRRCRRASMGPPLWRGGKEDIQFVVDNTGWLLQWGRPCGGAESAAVVGRPDLKFRSFNGAAPVEGRKDAYMARV